MLTYEVFNAFCRDLPDTSYVVQWGGSHVWKVGPKVFAIGGWNDKGVGITFKVSEIAFAVLKDMPGLRPAPYMASRGLCWIQHHAPPGLPDEGLLEHLRTSHALVSASLRSPARRRR